MTTLKIAIFTAFLLGLTSSPALANHIFTFRSEVNCAGYSYSIDTTGYGDEVISVVTLPVGPGTYSWNGATEVRLHIQVIWRRANGSTYSDEAVNYLYKPGGCTPEQESGPPPSASTGPPCLRYVRILALPGTEILWDGHIVFVSGMDGVAIVEYAPPGVHRITFPGGGKEIGIDSSFCGTLEVSILPEPYRQEEAQRPSPRPDPYMEPQWFRKHRGVDEP